MFGGLGAALALALFQNLQALPNAPPAVLDLSKAVVLMVTGVVSYLYYVLVCRLHSN